MTQFINSNPIPSLPTDVQRLANQSRRLQNNTSDLWRQMQQSFESLSGFVWQNPLGFDPQTVLNQFGTGAGDLFKLVDAYASMVLAYTGTALPSPVPAGWSYTVNADGTVTVKAPATN